MAATSLQNYHHGDLKQALINAATAIVADDQNWEFSLREVARRAGVSHNAPYRHFPEKRDLLFALAAAGFDSLRSAMIAAAELHEAADDALLAVGDAYVRFGIANPARFRLMFGPVLGSPKAVLPSFLLEAAAGAKTVLEEVISVGVSNGLFAADPVSEAPMLGLAAWSMVHGLTMLTIDGHAELWTSRMLPIDVGRILLTGVRGTGEPRKLQTLANSIGVE